MSISNEIEAEPHEEEWVQHGALPFIVNMVYTPFMILAMVMFIRRRHLQPIKPRHPFLVVVTSSFTLVFGLLEGLFRSFAIPCWLRAFNAHWIVPMVLGCYLTRALVLLFTFQSVQEKLAARNLLREEEEDPDFSDAQAAIITTRRASMKATKVTPSAESPFRRLQNMLLTPKGLQKFIICLAVLHGVQYVAVLSTIDALQVTLHCIFSRWLVVGVLVSVLFYGICLVIVSLRLRVVVERLAIKTELKRAGVNALCGVSMWFLCESIPALKKLLIADYSVIPVFLQLIALNFLLVSICYPLYLSYAAEEQQKFQLDTVEDFDNLKHLLNTKEGTSAFYDFLALEFALENLLFWEEAGQFKAEVARRFRSGNHIRHAHKTKLYNLALNVFQKYVCFSSPSMVNLPGKIVQTIAERLQVPLSGIPESYFGIESRGGSGTSTSMSQSVFTTSAGKAMSTEQLGSSMVTFVSNHQMKMIDIKVSELADVFDEAMQEIYTLMKRDSFIRFRGTQEYTDLIAKLKENELHNHVLREAHIL